MTIRTVVVLLWVGLVAAGSIAVSRHALAHYRHLLVDIDGISLPWPAPSKQHYVARRKLPANHYLLDSDLERPKTPLSLQIDPPKTVLNKFLRHEVCMGEPIGDEDVSASPFLASSNPTKGNALVLLPLPTEAKLDGLFTIGRRVTIVSSALKVRTGGTIAAAAPAWALVNMPAPCAALIAERKTEAVSIFVSSAEVASECSSPTSTTLPAPPVVSKKNS